MIETIQSSDLRRRVREVLDRIQRNHEPLIVYKYDSPQAVLIPFDDFEAYQAWLDHRKKRTVWLAELSAIADEVSAGACLTDAEAAALIAEAER
jgi:prevent-host-death family protein